MVDTHDSQASSTVSQPPFRILDDQSLRIGFDLVHDLMQTQLGQSDALDTKANFVLGSATVLIGTYAAFLAAWSALPKRSVTEFLVLNAPLALVYLVTLGFGYMGYMVRQYKVVPNPEKFVALLQDVDQQKTRMTLLLGLAAAYGTNSHQLARKAAYVSAALTFLCFEALVLIATFGMLALR